jgi:hypothetical protein
MSKARDIADLGAVTSRLDTVGASDGALSNRNLIINGAMQVAQRGSYTITTSGSPEYGGLDRFHVWSYASTEQVVADITQSTDVPSGNGFAYSYKFDVTTAESAVAASEALLIGQFIEAQNVQHLDYGTSSAKDVTMSFWIKSTKTGTYCFNINQPDGNRVYVKEYTVDASDTWEKKTITIEGDASGTINNDSGRGLWVQWVLMAGTNRQGTANTWRGSEFELATSNQVNALDSASNNIYITGVQLEVGDTATPFEHRSYGDELARCQRYYYKFEHLTQTNYWIDGYTTYAGYINDFYTFPVTMRTSPTSSFGTTWTLDNTQEVGLPTLKTVETNGWGLQIRANATGRLYAYPDNASYIDFDAEL